MSFFKAYDMRGTFGRDFDLETVNKIGQALPPVIARANGMASSASGMRILVGRDCRETSPAVRDALVAGLQAAGAQVSDLGQCTTPMVYYFTAADAFDGSIMITASHNPPSDNGLKVSMRGSLPIGYANGLNAVEAALATLSAVPCQATPPVAQPMPAALDRYLEFVGQLVPLAKLRQLRIGFDCSNGMSSLFVRRLFPEAVIVNDAIDGRFPAHSPNPLNAEARRQLAEVVRTQHLDCGVIFDGDADRAMFLDERGEFVQPDYLIPLVAAAMTAGRRPAAPSVVVHDVRTSRGALETLREQGFEPVMVPVGHAFAKPKMRGLKALCGGELAGHYYFGDFFGCDSGLIAALRILKAFADFRTAAATDARTFSAMMRPIVSRYANSGEMNFRVEDKDAAIARVMATVGPELLSRSEMDGIRAEFADWWFNIRKSNTEPYLRLIVEARTPELLAQWVERLSAAIDGNRPQSAAIDSHR